MTYGLLLWPHANQRYAKSVNEIAKSELQLILSGITRDTACEYREHAGMPVLVFEAEEQTDALLDAISDHSLLYWLVEIMPDGLIRPIRTRRAAYLDADLAGIQKYKGKTNELFTQSLINFALYSSHFSGMRAQPLTLFDPMCGRGTTLFQAVNRGWNAVGADLSRADIAETTGFLKRYLEYHRYKHTLSTNGRTVNGRGSVKITEFEFADTPAHMKEKDTRALRICCADGAETARAFGKNAFHLICADLPYGVQHAPGGNGGVVGFETLLARMLPALSASLLPGGAIALSYNTNTLKTSAVRAMLKNAGLRVCEGGFYDTLSHWVEQAVTRDLSIAVKE